MSFLLFLFYPLAIQYKKGGLWSIIIPFTFLTWLIDIYCNYTELSLFFWSFPKKGEVTFSKRVQTLCQLNGYRGKVATKISAYILKYDPNHFEE